ncbi:MAG: DUF4097 family beta strand repeat-containing protein [Sphingobacteriales bacterium]
MKTYLTLFIVACQSVVALAQDNGGKTPYLTKSLANDAISSVVVSTSAGGITVSGQSGQEARVEVYIKGNNGKELTKEEIQKLLTDDYDMSIAVNGHELTATVKGKHNFSNWRQQMSISFKIYVPQQVSTNLKTSGGGISLDNLKGNESFTTSGGGLNVDKLSGVIHGRTSGGGINVTNSNDDIDLVTSGGGIIAKNCEGHIQLRTSGGGLILENLKGTINAHTSGGGIEGSHVEGELITSTSGGGIDLKEMNCSLEASTSAGSLNAQMTGVGKYLRLSTSAGNIELDLPSNKGFDLNLKAESIDDKIADGFKGEWTKRHVDGSVNGGGIPVNAQASSGNIHVRFN